MNGTQKKEGYFCGENTTKMGLWKMKNLYGKKPKSTQALPRSHEINWKVANMTHFAMKLLSGKQESIYMKTHFLTHVVTRHAIHKEAPT